MGNAERRARISELRSVGAPYCGECLSTIPRFHWLFIDITHDAQEPEDRGAGEWFCSWRCITTRAAKCIELGDDERGHPEQQEF